MKRNGIGSAFTRLLLSALALTAAVAQNTVQSVPAAPRAPLAPLPPPLAVPKPGPTNGVPYAPSPILQGGIVVPLYPPGSPLLKADRIHEAEQYKMNEAVPGRIETIRNIHNPSIEVHTVDPAINTGGAVILVPGGGHSFLVVGSGGADFVHFFYSYGVNSIILRNRLRADGYDVQKDAVNDALQATRLVRAYAKEWHIDPKKIGIMGFSAGGELAAHAAVLFDDFDKKNNDPSDPLRGITSRPDFVGLIYPGPTPFAPGRIPPPIPRNVPPAFIASAGSGDPVTATWEIDYFTAMLAMSVPNIEMHIYGNGRHPGEPLSDGTNMRGGLVDLNGMPLNTWPSRYIDWFRDLGFLQKPGVETRAAKDIATYIEKRQFLSKKKEISVAPKVLVDYAGTYELGPGMTLVMTVEGDHLMTQATDQPKFPMFAESETKFFLKVVDAQVEFFRNDKGTVTHLMVHQEGQDIKAPRK